MEDNASDIPGAAVAAPAVLPAQPDDHAGVATPVAAAKPARKPGRPRKEPAPAPETPALEMAAAAPVAPAVKPVRKAQAKPAAKPAGPRPAAKTGTSTINKKNAASVKSAVAKQKEYSNMTTKTADMAATFQTVFKDATEKAKAAFEKSQASLADVGSFTKGNVEAVVESTKILATGLQELTKGYVAESKTVVETMQTEIKELASVKSPTEFFEKQNALLRKQFDAAVAASSKNSEAILKLASEAFQPISNRVSLAVEKIKQAA